LGVGRVWDLAAFAQVRHIRLSVRPSVPLSATNFSTAAGRICVKILH